MIDAYSCLADIRVLADLASDFSKLSRGDFQHAHLVEAPRLEQVNLVAKPVLFLEGIVTGHPRIPDGRQIVTSQLWGFLNGNAQYARTQNRWYRISEFHGWSA